MISKLKEKIFNKDKSNNFKSKININIIIIFFVSFITSLLIFKLTNNYILTILCILTIFITLFVIFNQLNNKDITKNKEFEFYNSFYKNFFYYSTINNSYVLGFKVAIDKLEISSLKDELINKIENKDYSQIEPITRKKEEVLLVDDLFYNLKNDELINEATFSKTEQLLNSYLKTIKESNHSNYLFLVLSFLLLIVSIIVFFSLFKR